MVRQEHGHIIGAGEDVNKAYTIAIRDLPGITHTDVFADIDLYTNSAGDDERIKAGKAAARDAVTEVKSISASLKVPCPGCVVIAAVLKNYHLPNLAESNIIGNMFI
jgi:hypothetical protein